MTSLTNLTNINQVKIENEAESKDLISTNKNEDVEFKTFLLNNNLTEESIKREKISLNNRSATDFGKTIHLCFGSRCFHCGKQNSRHCSQCDYCTCNTIFIKTPSIRANTPSIEAKEA